MREVQKILRDKNPPLKITFAWPRPASQDLNLSPPSWRTIPQKESHIPRAGTLRHRLILKGPESHPVLTGLNKYCFLSQKASGALKKIIWLLLGCTFSARYRERPFCICLRLYISSDSNLLRRSSKSGFIEFAMDT